MTHFLRHTTLLFGMVFVLLLVAMPTYADPSEPEESTLFQPESTLNSMAIYPEVLSGRTAIRISACADVPNFQLRSSMDGPGGFITQIFARSTACPPSYGNGWRAVVDAVPGQVFTVYGWAGEQLLSDEAFRQRAERYTVTVTALGQINVQQHYVTVPTIDINEPSDWATVQGTITVRGWAIDAASWNGSGVDQVQIHSGGRLLGNANYGVSRPDVGAAYGDSRFNNSGYSFQLDTTGLANGSHVIQVRYHITPRGERAGQWHTVERGINVNNAAPPPPSDAFEVFTEPSFAGSRCFSNEPMSANIHASCNDLISSVKLRAGWSVRVYRDLNQQGPSRCLTSSDSNLSDNTFEDGSAMNDAISSFILYNQSSCPAVPPPPPPPPTPTPQRPVVLLVHGIQEFNFNFDTHYQYDCFPTEFLPVHRYRHGDTSQPDWSRIGSMMIERGYDVYLADWTTRPLGTMTIEAAARDCLSPQLASIASRAPGGKVLLIAHSMGGLVSRAYIEGSSYRGDVEALVTLGTPHTGVDAQALLKLASLHNPKSMFVVGGICAASPGFCNLGSDYMSRFNARYKPDASIPYLLIGGTGGPLGGSILIPTEGRNDGIVGYRSATGYNYLGGLFGGMTAVVHSSSIVRRYSDSSHGGIPGAQKPRYVEDRVVRDCVRDYLDKFTTSRNAACETLANPSSILADSEPAPPVYTPMQTGVLTTGAVTTLSLELDGREAQVFLGVSDGQLGLSLTMPDGTVITPTNVSQVVAGGLYHGPSDEHDAPLISYHLPNPPAGRWQATIAAIDVITESTYVLFAALQSDLALTLEYPSSLAPSQPFQLTATVSAATTLIDGATVIASIAGDQGAQQVILNRTAPGVYTGQLTAPTAAGSHVLSVTATGNHNGAFARQEDTLVTVRATGVQRQGDATVTPVDQNGNGRYETLNVSVNYTVATPGDYSIMAGLQDSAGRLITLTYADVTWASGTQRMEVSFDGGAILAAGVDGPYRIVAQVIAAEGIQLVADEQPLITGLNYRAADFEAASEPNPDPTTPQRVFLPLVRR